MAVNQGNGLEVQPLAAPFGAIVKGVVSAEQTARRPLRKSNRPLASTMCSSSAATSPRATPSWQNSQGASACGM
jgi:hypothetical protein